MNVTDLLKLTDLDIAKLNTPQIVHYEPISRCGVTLYIKREELLHSAVSGNKVYKLLHHLRHACRHHAKTLISFGGYYSNHLHALAAAGLALNIKTVGVIRGHKPKHLNETLMDCQRWGMTLKFVSRQQFLDYRNQYWQVDFSNEFESPYVIPEGGGGIEGAQGCQSISQAVEQWFEGIANVDRGKLSVCVPCGTGTTIAGLISGSSSTHQILGFSALKANPQKQELAIEVQALLAEFKGSDGTHPQWSIRDEFHCGGFAKTTPELLTFIDDFTAQTGIPLDQVYTGKMLYGITQLASNDYWSKGQHIVAIHTGGLQGRRSLLNKHKGG